VPITDRPLCFGEGQLTITGWAIRFNDELPPCEVVDQPAAWLLCKQMQQPLAFGALLGPYAPASDLLWVASDPAGPVGPITVGAVEGQAVRTNTWVQVDGHFRDADAALCGPIDDPRRTACEGTFVVTNVTEIEGPVPAPLWSSECNPPVDILAVMVQTEPLACFGSADLTLEGTLGWTPWTMEGGCVTLEPTWFSCLSNVTLTAVRSPAAASSYALVAVSTPFVRAAVHPSSGVVPGVLEGSFVRVSGHFDDPAALTCTYGGAVSEGAISECRRTFVLTEIVPLE
jgi:hypothetical protein